MILDMREVMTITDYFVICHGRSKVHCQALAENVEQQMSDQEVYVKHIEGLKDGVWIILDYLDVVVHIFEEEARNFYDLRRLWVDAVEVAVPEIA
jgi:ribosome-associated protein